MQILTFCAPSAPRRRNHSSLRRRRGMFCRSIEFRSRPVSRIVDDACVRLLFLNNNFGNTRNARTFSNDIGCKASKMRCSSRARRRKQFPRAIMRALVNRDKDITTPGSVRMRTMPRAIRFSFSVSLACSAEPERLRAEISTWVVRSRKLVACSARLEAGLAVARAARNGKKQRGNG